ncbi:methyltransferase type 11 [Fusarium flagelliforme]|uniref:Methyltransferase type 11 n=1 Tax=Fusarium flagelliforme TaxID=2675880 RepID=A0A395MCS9_9HYPO|nr:methyltransferase type 11 [Fusarium flagelliforme]
MAYSDDSFILSWVREIPSNPPSPSQPHHRKRPQSDSEQLVSPPSSQEPRRADFGVEMPRTPVKRPRLATTSLLSESDRPSTQQSPGKSLTALAVTEGGVDVEPLEVSDKRIPRSLVHLSLKIRNIVGVVPKYLEVEIAKLSEKDDQACADFGPHVFLNSEKTYAPHIAPEIELAAAQLIVDGAADACRNQFDESGWNNCVHSPLLHLAFYGKKSRGSHLHEFQPCTSAGVQPAYLISNAQGKKAHELINKIRPKLNDTSINHTSHASLCAHPISVRVKTKTDGSNADKARLQLDVDELDFIAGIIVHGDQWLSAASTFDRSTNKTILSYSREPFGATGTLLSTFKAIAGIQHLPAWSHDIFWQWYKLHLPAAYASLCPDNTSMTSTDQP